jgi:NAD+ diphosphatase
MTLDRCNAERRTAAITADARMLVTDGKRFAIDGDRLARVPAIAADNPIFLGREDGTPLFVAPSSEIAETMLDFRGGAAVLPPEEVALLAYAHHLLQWSSRTRFCTACGTTLDVRNGGHVRVCAGCDAEHFPRIEPVVMIMATHRDRILLGRHHAFTHAWSTLAGFVEPGETIEDAAVRELHEETGVVARQEDLRYFGSQAWPLPSSLLMAFAVEVDSDEITIDAAELIEARFFAREELAEIRVAGPISLAGRMIAAFRNVP